MATGLYDDIIAPKSTGLFDDLIRDEPDPVEEKIAALKAGLTESQAASKSATRKATAYAIAANAIDIPGMLKSIINQPNRLAGLPDMGPLVSTDQIKKAASFLNPLPPSLMPQDEVSQQLMEGAAETASGLTAPENVLAAVAAKRFPTPVSTYFAGETLGAIPESTQRVLEAKSLPEAARALVPAAANVAGTGVLGQHLAGPMELPKLSPLLDALTGELTDEQIAQLRGNATRLEDLNASLPESQLTARTGPNPIIRVPAAPPLNGNTVAVQPPPAPPVVTPTPSVLDVADGPKVELPSAKGPSPRALPQVGETVQFEGEGDAVQSGKVVDLRVDEDQQVTPIVQTKDGLVALPDWQSGERIKPVKAEGAKPETTPKSVEADPIQFAAIRMPNGDVRKGQFHPLIEGSAIGEHGFVTKSGQFLTRDEAENHPKEIAVALRGDLTAEEIQDPYRRLAYAKKELEAATDPGERSTIERLIRSTETEIDEKTKTEPRVGQGGVESERPVPAPSEGVKEVQPKVEAVKEAVGPPKVEPEPAKVPEPTTEPSPAKSAEPAPVEAKAYVYHSPLRPVMSLSQYLPKDWKLIDERTFSLPKPLSIEQVSHWDLEPADPRDPVNLKKAYQKFRDELMKEIGESGGGAVHLKNGRQLIVSETVDPKYVEKYPFRITSIDKDGVPSGHEIFKDWDEVSRYLNGFRDDISKMEGAKSEVATAKVSKASEPKLTGHGKLSKEFDDLIRENGLQLGWVTNPDALYAQIGDASSTASIKAKIAQGKAMAVARQNAARDMGLNPTDVDTMQGRAKMLEALKQHVKEHMGADTLDSAGAPKGGSEFLPESKPVSAAEPVKPTGELFAPKEMPFNLTGEAVKPTEAKTGFGNDTMAQQEMFAIQKITELKDPAKSADAAQQIHGSPDAAAKALQRQLAVVDSDPVTKKAFAKEQRTRLQAVIQLLQQRAKPGPGTGAGPGTPSAAQMGITNPTLKAVADAFTCLRKSVQSVLAPSSVDTFAERTAGNIRERAAQMYREWIHARETLKAAQKMFDKQDNSTNLAFIARMERGQVQPTPQLESIARTLRVALADRVREVRALGSGKLQTLVQNYFPHLWKDPKRAASIFQSIFGKRPFEGPKAFLKRRSLPTTEDGIAAGLEPVSYNPVELTLLKLHEMDRYVMAHKVLNEMKENRLAKFVRFGERAPEGYAKIDDKIAQVIQMRPTVRAGMAGLPATGAPEAILRGNYWAPESAARVLNNYLSPGLRGNAIFDLVRSTGNALNQAQLGISAYHLTFTAIDSATSKVALGIEQIARSRGNPMAIARGMGEIAKGTIGNAVLYAPIENFLKGSKVLREYTKPGSVGGEVSQIVDSLIAAGGRVEMDTFYKNSAVESFWKALKERTPEGYAKAIWKAPWAALQYMSKPVMEVWVPRMKLGIFLDMAKQELAHLPRGAGREEVRATMAKAWDSVDNRMGQMVYDNLFWDKTLKDLSMVAVRSVGWNLGTLRELGGGMVDSATVLKRLHDGDPVLTHRMAYLIALPLTVGTMGAMYQYLATGKPPEKPEDYFLPRNGQKRADGSDERIILPSYMKDVLPLVKAGHEHGGWGVVSRAGRMAVNKANPQISLIADMLSNKDFYGRPIANPEDPLVKQVESYAQFVRAAFQPFSLRAIEKQKQDSLSAKAQSFMGLQPAPTELAPTAVRDMQNKARQFMAKQGKPFQQSPISDYHDLRAALETGNDDKAMEELQKLRKNRTDAVIFQSFQKNRTHPFTGSLAQEWKFKAALTPEEKQEYDAAKKERQATFERFLALWAKRNGKGL